MFCPLSSGHPDFSVDVHFNSVPNDELFGEQWGFLNYGQTGGTPGADIAANLAWEITTGSPDVVVAVIDDGFQMYAYQHPDVDYLKFVSPHDLAGKYLGDPQDDNPDPCEFITHGMAVGGLIIGDWNNEIGIAGLAPDVSFMPIKIAYDGNCGLIQPRESSLIASAWNWAWYHGAHVINASFSMPPLDNVHSSIIGAYNIGVLTVASTGNSAVVQYPARYDETLAVGATDKWDQVWYYSGKGSKLDVVAPSGNYMQGDIFTLDGVGETGYNPREGQCPPEVSDDYMCGFGGTSAASPLAVGIAALVLSRAPEFSGAGHAMDIANILRNSAEDMVGGDETPGWDQAYGYGRINALKALLSVTRGDANNTGIADIDDVTYLIAYIFTGGPAPFPHILMGDADCSGSVDLDDVVQLIAVIFTGGIPEIPCFQYGSFEF